MDRILILNSDMSIGGRYLSAQTSFISTLQNSQSRTKVIGLEKKWQDNQKISKHIAEFNPDLIYCIGSDAYLMGHNNFNNRPLLFSSLINWRRHPMTETTFGIANELPPNVQLKFFKDFLPDLKKVAILYNRDYNNEFVQIAQQAASANGLELIKFQVNKKGGTKKILKQSFHEVDGLWIIPDPIAISNFDDVHTIFSLSKKLHKPVFGWISGFARQGAVITIEPDISAIGSQAADLVKQFQTKNEIKQKVRDPQGQKITINLKVAQQYKLNINNSLLDTSDNIIR